MASMAYFTSVVRTGSAFDSFLFAAIGEDRNGTPISVLSALARLGVDPWLKADELAHLPKEAAGRNLAMIIASLTGAPSVQAQSSSIATRLIALLPGSVATNKPRPKRSFDQAAMATSGPFSSFAVIWVLMMAVVFTAQALMAGNQWQASPPIDTPVAVAAPQTPSIVSGPEAIAMPSLTPTNAPQR